MTKFISTLSILALFLLVGCQSDSPGAALVGNNTAPAQKVVTSTRIVVSSFLIENTLLHLFSIN